ncbi:MAG: alanine racemase [Candidatus Tectomicrobia bacterium]|nr:alanine racemase [Candidatus Tectomicrobia bacterium]
MSRVVESFLEIETPSVLLDQARVGKNIRLIQELANAHHVNVRPHIKTHKCLEIARMQLNEGATGITAAKTDEALVFMNDGVRSVTVAYPLVIDSKVDRLLKASLARNVDLRLVVDSLTGVEALSRSARKQGAKIGAFIEVDVGLHRCGIKEDDPLLITLARKIDQDRSLNFLGLLSHAGHAYGAKNVDEVRKIAQDEQEIMARIKQRLNREGIDVREISVGSTPTVLASDNFEEITEIRPGNSVFMDRTPLRFGLIEPDRIALSVLATVVSANSDYLIIDAGSKALSSDQGAHGIAGMEGYGLAYPVDRFQGKGSEMLVVKLSEEHGFVARSGVDLPIGSQVRIIPNHSCVVANLAETYIVVNENRVIGQWKIDARGLVL